MDKGQGYSPHCSPRFCSDSRHGARGGCLPGGRSPTPWILSMMPREGTLDLEGSCLLYFRSWPGPLSGMHISQRTLALLPLRTLPSICILATDKETDRLQVWRVSGVCPALGCFSRVLLSVLDSTMSISECQPTQWGAQALRRVVLGDAEVRASVWRQASLWSVANEPFLTSS